MPDAFTADEVGALLSTIQLPGEELLDQKRVHSVPPNLAAALAAVQAEIPEVVKAETAKIEGKEGRAGYKYSYADLAAVTRAILPRLGSYGLAWITKPTLLDGRFVLAYKLTHVSGESEEGIYPLPDRGSPQEIGSAITYARRYCLCSVTGVAPADDDDAAEAQEGHRRQGPTTVPPISAYEQAAGIAVLTIPTAEQRASFPTLMEASFQQALDFRACIDEHQAWKRPSQGEGTPTWGDLFTARVAAEIEACDTGEQVNTLWTTLKAAQLDMQHDGKKFSQLLRERGKAIKDRNAQALNTITEQVLSASVEDLDGENSPVLMSINQAHALGRLTDDEWATVHQLAVDRYRKLAAQNNDEAAPEEYGA